LLVFLQVMNKFLTKKQMFIYLYKIRLTKITKTGFFLFSNEKKLE